MATYSNILAWDTPWTEESGRLQVHGSQRVRHNLVTDTHALSNCTSFQICKSYQNSFSANSLFKAFASYMPHDIEKNEKKMNRLIWGLPW